LHGSVFRRDGESRPAELIVERRVPEQPEPGQELIPLVVSERRLEERRSPVEQRTNQHINSFYRLQEPPSPCLHPFSSTLDVVEGQFELPTQVFTITLRFLTVALSMYFSYLLSKQRPVVPRKIPPDTW
jgi:hypothetical protein